MSDNYISAVDNQAGNGRKHNQKMKPYLVYKILKKQTDAEHYLTVSQIIDILKERYGIYAERKSVVRDIQDINKALVSEKEFVEITEIDEYIEDYIDYFPIVYDPHKKGYALLKRDFTTDEIKLLAEIIYSTNFIKEAEAKKLSSILLNNVSEYEAERIEHKPFYMARTKTPNDVFANVSTINEAIKKQDKISFKYMHYDIKHLEKQTARRKGEYYIASPFELIINNGYYYLLAMDDERQTIRTYRVDRMQHIDFMDEPIDCQEEFEKIDLSKYTQKTFNMFGGKEVATTIRFNMSLLDTVVDRFGTKDLIYVRLDDHHFSVKLKVDISPQFYAWIIGFGTGAVIEYPPEVVEGFIKYIDNIKKKY